jgi:NDP-sugar pyrophosphorylase family protein
MMFTPQEFFDLKDFDHRKIFFKDKAVWTALDRLPEYLDTFFQQSWPLSNIMGQINKPLIIYDNEVRDDLNVKTADLSSSIYVDMKGKILKDAAVIMPGAFLNDDRIIIGPGTIVEPGAFIKGPTVIGCNSEIRQGAYIRGNCLIGNRCVVGHTTEIKGSIMLDGARAGHFAYIGDSILGKDVNLGAGTKLANLKVIPGSIVIAYDKKRFKTGRRKLGAVLGDGTETGCNSVTSPGTLTGPASIIYAGVAVPGGYYPSRTFFTPSKGSLQIHTLKS